MSSKQQTHGNDSTLKATMTEHEKSIKLGSTTGKRRVSTDKVSDHKVLGKIKTSHKSFAGAETKSVGNHKSPIRMSEA